MAREQLTDERERSTVEVGPGRRGPAPEARTDARVEAVHEVLRGAPVAEVAARWAIEPPLLERWLTQFVDAGVAAVTNQAGTHSDSQRDRFLGTFAFGVRSPLTVAMGWADLMGSGELSPEAYVETATRLQLALNQLSEHIADAELLVAVALGGLSLDKARVTAHELCDLPGLPAVGGDGPETILEVDPDHFRRIVRDLWDAAASAPVPTTRRLRVVSRGPWVEISVVREGDPIDTDHLRALFEPFDSDQLYSGITIGLYLARALTVAHGGTIGVDQNDDDSVFWVRIPRGVVASQPPAPLVNGEVR